MNSDYFINNCDADYFALRREYHARGFSGESYDMRVMQSCQRWRLTDGAEPNHWLSGATPATHMRYGPYRTTPDAP